MVHDGSHALPSCVPTRRIMLSCSRLTPRLQGYPTGGQLLPIISHVFLPATHTHSCPQHASAEIDYTRCVTVSGCLASRGRARGAPRACSASQTAPTTRQHASPKLTASDALCDTVSGEPQESSRGAKDMHGKPKYPQQPARRLTKNRLHARRHALQCLEN